MNLLNCRFRLSPLIALSIPLFLLPILTAGAQNLEIYCIEVGLSTGGTFGSQGNSTLIIGPNGTSVLIDAGNGGDSGANSVLALFSRLSLADLDYMITTHWDSDHYNGMDDVGGSYLPTTIYDLGDTGTPPGTGYETTFSGRRSTPSVGTTINLGSGCTLTFVCVDGHIYGGGYVDPNGTDNGRSIGVLVKYGGFDYLSLGDLEGVTDATPHVDIEGPLATALEAAGYQIDVLHVSHHGSQYSTKNAFCADIAAEYAVISTGDGNNYSHPHQYAINHLNALTDGGSAYAPAYPAVTRIYTLEEGEGGTAGNVTIVGAGHATDPTLQGSLHITVQSDGSGAQFSFANEGPNTYAISHGPYDSDEGGMTNGVVLNEIMPNPATDYYTVAGGGGTTDNDNEYVELYNAGATAADVSGWRIKKDGTLLCTIDSTTATQNVPAGGHILIVRNDTYAEQGGVNITGSRSAYTGSWSVMGNSGGYTITLHNSSDTQIDSVAIPSQTFANDRPYHRSPDGGSWIYAGVGEQSPTGYSSGPTPTPTATPSSEPVKVNYQPTAEPTPVGFIMDTGWAEGYHGGDYSYGW